MHLMVDIETMGTGSFAPVIEIAVVEFDRTNVYRTFHSYVLPDFARSVPTASTIAWWNRQEVNMPLEEAAEELDGVLVDLVGWLGTLEIEGVWANAPSFDLVILHNLAQAYNMEMPWHIKQSLDCGTMFRIGKAMGIERSQPVIKHHAAHDAHAQAWSIINIHDVLMEKGVRIL